jgi:hypothetical protein
MIVRSEVRSTLSGSRPRTSYQTVGTAMARVARSAAMNRASGAAWVNRFGSSRSAPTSQPAYGMPQALPWNMGTTGSSRSYWFSPSASPEHTPSECRNVERWLYTTPFGQPVVPLV